MATRSSSTRRSSKSSSKAQVTLNGRFRPGERVRLVEVAGEHVLRSEGGTLVGEATVDENGQVQFTSGVKAGGRYFVVGRIAGVPIEVRARGNVAADDNSVLAQAPVQPDVTTTGIGRQPVDPDSEPHGLRLAQEQVGDGVQQRSSTATGTAHPVDPDERGPYPDQGDELYSCGEVQQRSDTEVGQATPIPDVPERQEDVPESVHQRSCTATGVATPLPAGDAVDAVQGIESALAKAAVGEPSQADLRGGVNPIPGGGEPHVDLADRENAEEDKPVRLAAPRRKAAAGPEAELTGQALKDRAAELDIKGRGRMTADKLRAAVRDAQK